MNQRGRVFLRPPVRSDREEFVSLMRSSRSFHRPWATAPTDGERFAAYIADSRRPDFEAMLVCRREDLAILWEALENAPVVILGGGNTRLGMARYRALGQMWNGDPHLFCRLLHERRVQLFLPSSDRLCHRRSCPMPRMRLFVFDRLNH